MPRQGIEPILLEQGEDLEVLATAAVSSGADVIGMAEVTAPRGLWPPSRRHTILPYVCVPAGTRNHFALDIGIDRGDLERASTPFIMIRAPHRSSAGQRSGLCEQRIHGLVRQDRPVA